ncbi:MAG: reverse transcriptase family protein [Saprospiraceae bacterium]
MNPGQEHIDKIRTAFKEMQGKEDFLALLNIAKPLVYGEHAVPFEIKQLTWHSNPKLDTTRYKTFEVRKKSGDKRTIHAPQRGLKALQKTISFILQCVYTPHKSATGFIWDKSIVDNATIHAGFRYVYNTDLKDFFPSIDQARVWKCLQLKPFNLKEERLVIANMIAAICCTEMEVERKNDIGEWEKVKRNVLPQGAPTSPVITNIICQRLDFLLSAVAKRFGLNYSRYADDITFSSMHTVYQADSEFTKELHRIIAEQRFDIKESKTRLQKDGYRKEVTGLLVNEKVNVQKRYIKQLRQWLYYWEQYGFEKASVYFIQKYIAEKGHVKKGRPNMENVIAGKLDYLKMVKGGENELYLKLRVRLLKLINEKNISIEKTNDSDKENSDKLDFFHFNFPVRHNMYILNKNEEILMKPKNEVEINDGVEIILKQVGNKTSTKLLLNKCIPEGTLLPYFETFENKGIVGNEINLSKHKPIDVTHFLFQFANGNGLKFLTHEFPGKFEYKNILKSALIEFSNSSAKFKIPSRLWSRINQFGFGDPSKSWYSNGKSYKLNWKSKELLNWITANPNIHPATELSPFRDSMIIPFSKSYRIIAPELFEIIKNKLAEKGMYTTFDFVLNNERLINLDKPSFYTDVDSFSTGLGYLFNSINQRIRNSNELKIEFSSKSDDKGRKRIIKIVHMASDCNKPLDKIELFQGDLLEAEKAFFGICDWSIISKSPDDSVNKLNVLFDINSDKIPKEKIDDSLIEGFTHVLTFYA